MRKKILVGVVCLTMVASMLAGCGDKKEDSRKEDSTVEITTETVGSTGEDTTEQDSDREQAIQNYYDKKAELEKNCSVYKSGKDHNISWTIYDDGTLMIDGHGDYSIDGNHCTAWCNEDYRHRIESAYVCLDECTSLEFMFYETSNLKSVDLSALDTSNVVSFNGMFSGCNQLAELDVSNFDTSNATTMRGMFEGCAFEEIDVSNFDTSSVTDMGWMFDGCVWLEKLDLSNFNTMNVNNMERMFQDCRSLKELNVSNFNVSSVTNKNQMFYECDEGIIPDWY